jgi:hypothetical protein
VPSSSRFLLKSQDEVFFAVALNLLLTGTSYAKQHGFLKDNGNGTWVIGNDVWNMTQDNIYGSKLYYKDKELDGKAAGHYVSYDMLPLLLRCHISELTS